MKTAVLFAITAAFAAVAWHFVGSAWGTEAQAQRVPARVIGYVEDTVSVPEGSGYSDEVALERARVAFPFDGNERECVYVQERTARVPRRGEEVTVVVVPSAGFAECYERVDQASGGKMIFGGGALVFAFAFGLFALQSLFGSRKG